MCSDGHLTQTVNGAVRLRCGRSVLGLAVTVERGVVTLAGQVRGFYSKQVLLSAARSVRGVVQVIDRVEVLPLDQEADEHSSELEPCGMT
jgi:osmotically-inducible protein OsmY